MKSARETLIDMIDKGNHELDRESSGLLLSSLSAGLDIGFGPLLMGVFLTVSATGYGDPGTELLLALAYSVGFTLVILGRSELFTEHTTLAVMPVLNGEASIKGLGRLWSLVFIGNIVGGAVFAALAVLLMPGLGVIESAAFETIALKMTGPTPFYLFLAAVFAGWLMGLLAWLLSAADSTASRLAFIVLVTATIGLLHLPHSIAGNVEVLMGLITSEKVTAANYLGFLALSTLGNAVGGSVFVGLTKYGHVVRGAK